MTAESAFAGALTPPDSPPDEQEGIPEEHLPSNAAMDARNPPHLARSSSHGLGSGESGGSGRLNAPAWLHVPRPRSGAAMARIPSWLHFQTLGRCQEVWNRSFRTRAIVLNHMYARRGARHCICHVHVTGLLWHMLPADCTLEH